jgi:mersacidin/lichenicidin family type 2 lantibiotic
LIEVASEFIAGNVCRDASGLVTEPTRKGTQEMSNSDVIRAWKDPAYRASLTAGERAALPANPAGTIDVTETELTGVEGGGSHNLYCINRYVAVQHVTVSIQCPFVLDFGKIVTNPASKAALGGMTLYR